MRCEGSHGDQAEDRGDGRGHDRSEPNRTDPVQGLAGFGLAIATLADIVYDDEEIGGRLRFFFICPPNFVIRPMRSVLELPQKMSI